MPEDVTPPEGNSTPTVDWDSPDNPYLKRFQDTQSAYTQNQQRLAELAELETDREKWMALGAKHGVEFEIPGTEPDPGIDPALAAMQAELAETRAWKAEVEAERQTSRQEQGMALFHRDLDTWAKADDTTLSPADHNAIYGVLMQSQDPTQESSARAAYEAHVAHKKAERAAWEAEFEEQRKRPRVPRPPVGGQAATGVPNWDEMSPDDQDRYMAAQLRSANA